MIQAVTLIWGGGHLLNPICYATRALTRSSLTYATHLTWDSAEQKECSVSVRREPANSIRKTNGDGGIMRPMSSSKGIRTTSGVIGISVSGVPRGVYELAADNIREAGLSLNEVFTSLIYRWANIPSRLSAKFELLTELEESAMGRYEEKLETARLANIKESEFVVKLDSLCEQNEQEETERLMTKLAPIVARYSSKLHFGAAANTDKFFEHEDTMSRIRFELGESIRTPTDREVFAVYTHIVCDQPAPAG